MFLTSLLTDWSKFRILAALLICGDIALNVGIINFVLYTEIDWKAYMQEVEGFMGGELDYTKMKGDTGPLVYPAGFLYIFSGLRYITGYGVNVRLAQYIWAGFYTVTLAIVLAIYGKAKITSPWTAILLCMSYRLHSIFALRLFNDCIAMMLCYLSVFLFQRDRWSVGCFFFSLAVSVKMNVLLFAPGLLCLLLQRFGFWWTIPRLAICGFLQLILGAPFLLTYPLQYIKMAFDLGRVFFFVWTVNWKFLPEDFFVSKTWAITLLALHLSLLCLWAWRSWRFVPARRQGDSAKNLPASHITKVLFISNFVGILCSRSLHYQFYSWYFHTIPLLLWLTPYGALFKLIIFAEIELMWNVYPSNAWSSGILLAAHLLLMLGLALGPRKQKAAADEEKKTK